MSMPIWTYALSGAIMTGYATAGLFFLRYWRKTHDRLFAIFAIAFWVLTAERFLLIVIDPSHEVRPYIYTVRLVAFMLILYAVIDKNSKREP